MLKHHDLLAIGTAADADALHAALVSAAQDLGFGIVSGGLVRGRLSSGKATIQGFGNTPAEFQAAFKSLDLAVRDPLSAHMTTRPGFVSYDQAFYARAGAGDLWDFQAPFGYRAGVAFSIHEESHAEVFMCGLDGTEALPSSAGARVRLEAAISMLAVHAREAVRSVYFPEVAAMESAGLERMELEALQWAAGGVSIRRVGDRMRVSDADALRITASAARKLGANTRTGAALRAIRGGLVNP
jgi:LuxR family transcriptional regulator